MPFYKSISGDGGKTWTDERQVTSFLQCSGDLALLPDGTLVLEYLHRFPDDITNTGVHAKISDTAGRFSSDGVTYVLGDGDESENGGACYPGNIANADGSVISTVLNWVGESARLEVVHWSPLPVPDAQADPAEKSTPRTSDRPTHCPQPLATPAIQTHAAPSATTPLP